MVMKHRIRVSFSGTSSKNLTREFTAVVQCPPGSAPVRTVFAVGDEKQSIYSFQGAQPEAFDASRPAFPAGGARGRAGLRGYSPQRVVPLDATIIDLVDQVFAVPRALAWTVRFWLANRPSAPKPPARMTLGGRALGPGAGRRETEARGLDAPPDTTERRLRFWPADRPDIAGAWMLAGRDDLGRTFAPVTC